MNAQTPDRAYERVKALLESLGGEMQYHAGGAGGGGRLELTLGGRTRWVEVRDRSVNDLDKLYVAAVKYPKTWDDYDEDAPLLPDATERLVALFEN